ncbi:MAG: ADP-ribosylglycohydrolase family protein [Dehalobacterium sp.]|jgi:ADP-ribosylglycohydrolase
MEYNLHNRILGALIGAGAGDAMGAATEARTTEQIREYFGHTVTDFETPPMDTFGAGNKPGQLTDDFSSAFFLAKSIVDNHGIVDQEAVQNALINWSEHAVFFDRFAGPTTRLAIRRFKGEEIRETKGVQLVTRQATNGSAMRISPIGLLNPGNLDQTIADAVTVTMITHDNYLAISGACAVACAVSRAVMMDSDVYNVLQAALYGAGEGERLGLEVARDVAGPSVLRRMEVAIEIGLGRGTPEEKMREIGDRVGTGLHISEAVPAAIGFFAANSGDALGSIIGAVNVGYDTDTVATMSGAIAGALKGAGAYPEHFLPTMESVNGLDISGLAVQISSIANKRMKGGC